MLKTRNRENILIDACLVAKQPFVVDNTNLTAEARKEYIDKAKSMGFAIIGYYFRSSIDESIGRNNLRAGKEKLPLLAIRGAHGKLERPGMDEGYDELYYAYIENDDFIVEEYKR
jgi:predicted kinase